MKAIGFDFGQTLAELDYEFIARRLGEKSARFETETARASSQRAWQVYGDKKSLGHELAWRAMMEEQLRGGGVPEARIIELSAWLWSEQPRQNLWRRPIAGMIELVRELKQRGVPVAIISNSEGHLAELVAELGWASDFDVVVDSGRLGVDKPDRRIFEHACAAIDVSPEQLLHVGDSWEADVQGALGAAASAVWFDARHGERALPERVFGASSATELREVLARVGLLS
jgi:HAD superfamily hydrolase (TIGR01549 family)